MVFERHQVMQKFGTYIILVVVGALIGAVGIGYFSLNQNLALSEEVKVTIQDIEYVGSDYQVLEIDLLNDAPEKNLEGSIVICQANKEWTNQVSWYYTGEGKTVILCDGINQDQSFEIKYEEKNNKAIYLNRKIQWNEISIRQGSSVISGIPILAVENVRFFIQDGTKGTEITLRNSGTKEAKINEVYAGTSSSNLLAQNSVMFTPTSQIVAGGSTLKITIQNDWTVGTRYYFKVDADSGISLPFSRECSDYVIGFIETTELTITKHKMPLPLFSTINRLISISH